MVSLYLELCKCDWRSSSGEHFGPHKAMAAGNSDEEGREEGGMKEGGREGDADNKQRIIWISHTRQEENNDCIHMLTSN